MPKNLYKVYEKLAQKLRDITVFYTDFNLLIKD